MSDYKETKLYRRTKYILFNLLLIAAAFCITFALFFFIPTTFFAKIFSETATFGILWVIWFFLIRRTFLGGWLGRLIVYFQRFRDTGRYSKGGNARFTGMLEEYLFRKVSDTSIYLGRSLFSRFWSIGPKSDKHMITIGGTRSGKGACCMIPNLLKWNGSILCIDPKGTNTHVTAERRRRMGNTVHIIDPFHVTTTETASFNPLDIIDTNSRTVSEDIKLIADALIPEDADTKQPHFPAAAKAIFSGYIVHVLTSGLYENPSLIDVFDIVHSSGDEWIDTHARMMMNTSCRGLAKIAAVAVREGIDKGEHHSVISTMKTQLHWLTSVGFPDVLARSSFSFEDMKNNRTSVYLVIPPDMLKIHNKFLRLFVSIAISRYSRGGKAKIPGLFVIDEAAALGHLEEIETAYSLVGSYNLKMWTFFQNRGQLDKHYGSEAKSLINGSHAVQLFAIEHEDAEWVAAMLGTRSMVDLNDLSSASSVMGLRNAASIVDEIGDRANEDLAKAQYIIRLGKLPMKLDMLPYFRSYTFAPLAFRDPDHPWPTRTHIVGRYPSIIKSFFINFFSFEGRIKPLRFSIEFVLKYVIIFTPLILTKDLIKLYSYEALIASRIISAPVIMIALTATIVKRLRDANIPLYFSLLFPFLILTGLLSTFFEIKQILLLGVISFMVIFFICIFAKSK